MRSLIHLNHPALRGALIERFDQWVESCAGYYDTPAGAGTVVPEIPVPSVADQQLRHSLGLDSGGEWRVWTRSSGTVVAITEDGSRLLVAGRRHSIAEVLGGLRLGSWTSEPARRPQFTAGCWLDEAGDVAAEALWLNSQEPECDPLRPV